MILACEVTLALALARPVRTLKKEYVNIGSKADIASKSCYICDNLVWDSASSSVFNPDVIAAPTMYQQIDSVCRNLDNYEDGDTPLEPKPIDDLKAILREAEEFHDAPIRAGHIIPCFGELSITWHYLDRMLMITAFSDARGPRIDFGTTPSNAPGQYGSDSDATSAKLAEKLAWLYGYSL
jgi:hypothetical protein